MELEASRAVKPCKRCTALVTTLDPPPLLFLELYELYGGICPDCLTTEERKALENITVQTIAKSAADGLERGSIPTD